MSDQAGAPASQAGERPKITVAVTFPVYPPRGGGQSRIFYLYREIARSFEVELVTLASVHDQAATLEIAPGLREIRVPKTPEHERRELRLSARMGHVPVTDVVIPRIVHLTPDYLGALHESAKTSDVLIACHPYLMHALLDARKDQMFAFEAQDVEADLKAGILPANLTGLAFLALTEATERDCCHRSQLTFACSEQDAAIIERKYGPLPTRPTVAPNGADIEEIRFTDWASRMQRRACSGKTQPRKVLFIGSWHGPNIESLFFVLEIARRLPAITFVIIGSVSAYPDYFQYSVPPNITLAGAVTDEVKNQLLSSVDLAINPMEHGSGTNLKMLDYMAAGVPVLTTSFGARGLGLVSGKHVFIADLIDFTDRITAIADLPCSTLDQLTREARQHVERNFSWTLIGQKTAHTLHETLRRHQRQLLNL